MAYAGTWESTSPTQWTYRHDDGSYQPGGWFKDPADGRWYYLDQDGVMMFGWQYLDNVWYPLVPGNVVNACTYDFPVRMKAVPGLDTPKLHSGDPAIFGTLFVRAVRKVVL